jgi:UDP-N-acetylglucosamine 2-epimerase (non-hydrolysing)
METEALKQQFPRYGVVTLHRPSNVDDEAEPARHRRRAARIAAELPLIFPVHPRTRGNLEKFGLDLGPNVVLTAPSPTCPSSTCGRTPR